MSYVGKGEKTLDRDEILRRVHYDHDTGRLYRKDGLTGVVEGDELGSVDSYGSLQCVIGGVRIFVRDAVWMIEHGGFSKHVLAHRNGDKTDNRIENLIERPARSTAWYWIDKFYRNHGDQYDYCLNEHRFQKCQ